MSKMITVVLTLLALALTACSALSPSTNGPGNGGALSPMSQLAAGTLKLDGTKNAVTKEQAAQLIPMWQVYKQLDSSDTAAQQEIDGLSAQIRDTMTADQRKAINDLKITQSDVMAYMQPNRSGSASGSSSPSNRSTTSQGGFPGGPGGMPPGGMMGDPGGIPPGMTGSSTSRQSSGTQTANGTQSGAQNARPANMNRVPTPLFDALIQYLQKVAAS